MKKLPHRACSRPTSPPPDWTDSCYFETLLTAHAIKWGLPGRGSFFAGTVVVDLGSSRFTHISLLHCAKERNRRFAFLTTTRNASHYHGSHTCSLRAFGSMQLNTVINQPIFPEQDIWRGRGILDELIRPNCIFPSSFSIRLTQF